MSNLNDMVVDEGFLVRRAGLYFARLRAVGVSEVACELAEGSQKVDYTPPTNHQCEHVGSTGPVGDPNAM